MKRALVVALAFGLVAGSLAMPAEAKKKKKKPPPAPVATTLYFHGPSQFGEVDGAQWLADGGGPISPLTLDTSEPTGGQAKSMNYFSPALNSQCTGLPLAYPTFNGDLVGTIVGDAKITAHFASAPATVTARIWADMGAFANCNDAYVAPASEVEFDVPGGQSTVEIVFPGLNLPAQASILIEILAPDAASGYEGQVGRLLYDSTSAPTKIEFGCVPATGATSCVPS